MLLSLGILIVLPAGLLVGIWKSAFKSKLEWLLDVLATTVLIACIFQTANWSSIGSYWRYIWIVLLVIAIVTSWRRVRDLPFRIKYTGSQKVSIGINILLILVFTVFNGFVLTSYSVKDQAIDLAFPLKDGTYYVGHGGNHVHMNYHQAHPPQKYALDILGLNKLGTRATGLYPKDLDKYEIYENNLYSPCNGIVIETRNDIPDLTPPEMDPENTMGNYVALTCNGHEAIIYLMHMQQESVSVTEGEEVTTGQLLGKIGNSGNTSEPHLHIHAELDGVGVPITFEGKFLVRNSIVR
nr:M23 family metallopeptidase [Sporosarcina sp. 6E9]